MVVIAVHIVIRPEGHVHGPGDTLSDFLRQKGIPHVIISHSLNGDYPTRVAHHAPPAQPTSWIVGRARRLPLPLQAFTECLRTVRIVRQLATPVDLFIGIDPLNALAGVWLKKNDLAHKVIFYTADYAEDRFSLKWLNALYHFIDRLCLRFSDRVWNVSSRILRKRQEQSVPLAQLRLIPNSVSLQAVAPVAQRPLHRYEVVSMATTRDTMENRLLVEAVAALRCQCPKIHLKILGAEGGGGELKSLISRLGIGDAVSITGLRSHPETLHLLKEAAIGVALYTRTQPWTVFGDSKKVREYLACGLPVLMTDVPSTADEVRQAGAGLIVPLDCQAVGEALWKLLSDDSFYIQCRQAASQLAHTWDMDRILSSEFQELGILQEMAALQGISPR